MMRIVAYAAVSALSMISCVICAVAGILQLGDRQLNSAAYLLVAMVVLAVVARTADRLKKRALYGQAGFGQIMDSDQSCWESAQRDLLMYHRLTSRLRH